MTSKVRAKRGVDVRKSHSRKVTASAMMLVLTIGSLAVSTPALADDQDKEDYILDPILFLPGVGVKHNQTVGDLSPLPHTPLKSYNVFAPFPNFTQSIQPIQKIEVCSIEGPSNSTPASCPIQETFYVTNTCDAMFKSIRLIDTFGNELANALEDIVRTVDGTVDEVLHQLFDNQPAVNPDWGNTTRDALVECSLTIDGVRGQLGTGGSFIDSNITIDYEFCPSRSLLCEEVNYVVNVHETAEGNDTEILNAPCFIDNLAIDCGTVDVLGEEVDPFEPWNQAVDNLSTTLVIPIFIEQHDQETASTSPGEVSATGGSMGCTAGGYTGEGGNVFPSWTLYTEAFIGGGNLPPEVQDGVSDALALVFAEVNGALADASARWAQTIKTIVREINEVWQEEDDTLADVDEDDPSLGRRLGMKELYVGGNNETTATCEEEAPDMKAQVPDVHHEHLEPKKEEEVG